MNLKKLAIALAVVVLLVGVGAWLTKPVLAHRSGLIDAEVELTMKDFGFDLKMLKNDGGGAEIKDGILNLKAGKTVRFKIKNAGSARHDLHLGEGKSADTKDELYKNTFFKPFDMLELDAGAKADLTLTIPDLDQRYA